MKAKEYAAEFEERIKKGEEPVNVVRDFLGRFLEEMGELIKVRHVKSNSGAISAVNEVANKWVALSRLVPCIKKGGFLRFLKNYTPDDEWCALLFFGLDTSSLKEEKDGIKI